MEHLQNLTPSPCLTCTRVQDPGHCENKSCQVWARWFAQRWASIHGYYEKYANTEGIPKEKKGVY